MKKLLTNICYCVCIFPSDTQFVIILKDGTIFLQVWVQYFKQLCDKSFTTVCSEMEERGGTDKPCPFPPYPSSFVICSAQPVIVSKFGIPYLPPWSVVTSARQVTCISNSSMSECYSSEPCGHPLFLVIIKFLYEHLL